MPMYSLKFDVDVCKNCPTGACLVNCQYLNADQETAVREMVNMAEGKDSFVLQECVTCYACEEYCKRGNHPFYLITEKREEKGILTAPRAITTQWINLCEPQGKYRLGEVKEKALSFGFMPEFLRWAKGKLFEDVMPSFIFGQEFFCNVVYIHFAETATFKKRLPGVIENFEKLGVQEVVFLHDECYGAFAHLAPAYGMEVPFKPIHYYEYLYNRLNELRDLIQPLNIRVAYQRPCSARLCADKHHFVADIMDLIGVELVQREYQDQNALCCGGIFSMCFGYDLAHDVQERNIEDMKTHQAQYCVFNCLACQNTLGSMVAKAGIKPIHMIHLCRMAIGEM